MLRIFLLAIFILSFNAAQAEELSQRSIFDKEGIQSDGEKLKKEFEIKLNKNKLELTPSEQVEEEIIVNQPDIITRNAEISIIDEPDQNVAKTDDVNMYLFEFDRVPLNRSIFFTDREVRNMNIIYKAYLDTVKKEDVENAEVEGEAGDIISSILEDLETKKKQELQQAGEIFEREIKVAKLPAYFYLNSIIYRNPNNISIWLNGQKFSDDYFNGLEIRRALKDRVEFEWEINEDRVNIKNWAKKAEDRREYSSNPVAVDIENRVVSFTLEPNQMLDAKNMIVVEGKRTAKSLENLDDYFYDPMKPEDRLATIKEKVISENAKKILSATEEIQSENPANGEIKSDEEILQQLRDSGKL